MHDGAEGMWSNFIKRKIKTQRCRRGSCDNIPEVLETNAAPASTAASIRINPRGGVSRNLMQPAPTVEDYGGRTLPNGIAFNGWTFETSEGSIASAAELAELKRKMTEAAATNEAPQAAGGNLRKQSTRNDARCEQAEPHL